MAKVYLHLGLHKTGTTSIQGFLGENSKYLRNTLYPTFTYEKYRWLNHSIPLYNLFSSNGNQYHQNKLLSIDHESIKAETLRQLTSHLRSNKDIILSGEALSLLPEKDLNAVNSFFQDRGYTVHAIVYTRDPYDYFTSALQQSIKTGGCIEDFKIRTSFRQKLTRIINSFENIVIHSYDSVINSDLELVDHFMSSIKLNTENTISGRIKRNSSLSQLSARLLSSYNTVNRFYDSSGAISPIRKVGDTKALHNLTGGGKFQLTDKEILPHRPFLEEETNFLKSIGISPRYTVPPSSPYKPTTTDFRKNKSLIENLTPELRDFSYTWFSKEIGLPLDCLLQH